MKERFRKLEKRMYKAESAIKRKMLKYDLYRDGRKFLLGVGTSGIVKSTPWRIRFVEGKPARRRLIEAETRVHDTWEIDFPRLPKPAELWSTVAKRVRKKSEEGRPKPISGGKSQSKPSARLVPCVRMLAVVVRAPLI